MSYNMKLVRRNIWWRSRVYAVLGLANAELYDKIIRILDSYIKRVEGGGK